MLETKGKPAATHDSADRTYPPRCHNDTRKSMRGRIVDWGMLKDNKDLLIYWVMGPAGVGKSAVGQTVAEHFAEKGRLGASFFFSRPNHINDPDTVIPTLAFQLAVNIPEYRAIITQRFADNPTILRKNRRIQFRELIAEPFGSLVAHNPNISSTPLLIIIDGLDECNDEEAQCEFIELISSVNHLPLRWMICSRPEYHLKSLQSDADFHIPCVREDIDVDDAEAQRDVQRLLRDELEKIRRRYRDQLPSDWPPQEHVRRIAAAASGHLGFADFVLRFIGDKQFHDPDGRLETCVRFIGGGGVGPGATNPLHALDLLYRQILSDIPDHYLQTAMRIISLHLFYPDQEFTAQEQATFFLLSRTAYYGSLWNLHSVLFIPSAGDAYNTRIRVYHASFSDYLRSPQRSGKFCIDEGAAQYDIATFALRWVLVDEEAKLRSLGEKVAEFLPSPTWLHPKYHGENWEVLKRRLRWFSDHAAWVACRRISDNLVPDLLSRLYNFPFCLLSEDSFDYQTNQYFVGFILWLYTQIVSYSFVVAGSMTLYFSP